MKSEKKGSHITELSVSRRSPSDPWRLNMDSGEPSVKFWESFSAPQNNRVINYYSVCLLSNYVSIYPKLG